MTYNKTIQKSRDELIPQLNHIRFDNVSHVQVGEAATPDSN